MTQAAFTLGDLVTTNPTGRAYKKVTGNIVEIKNGEAKISLTGRAYKTITRKLNQITKR